MVAEQLWRRLHEDEEALRRAVAAAGARSGAEAAVAAASANELLLQVEQTFAQLEGASSGNARAATAAQLDAVVARIATQRAAVRNVRERAAKGRLFNGGGAGGGDRKAGGAPSSQAQKEAAELRALTEARSHLGSTMEQFQDVQRKLDETSATIASTQRQYDEYGFRLKDAAALLGQLKRRTEDDTKYIWWSFWFFVGVCVFIVLRRFRVFQVVWLFVSMSAWTGSTAAGTASEVATQVATAFREMCEALGIPSLFGARKAEF